MRRVKDICECILDIQFKSRVTAKSKWKRLECRSVNISYLGWHEYMHIIR